LCEVLAHNYHLKPGNVIVRPLGACALPHCLRITIGTEEQNLILLDTLQAVLEEITESASKSYFPAFSRKW
jgi:histidinol-phosphate/aromatic aminotransferase/cobyric acid decarboxylase-like protein